MTPLLFSPPARCALDFWIREMFLWSFSKTLLLFRISPLFLSVSRVQLVGKPPKGFLHGALFFSWVGCEHPLPRQPSLFYHSDSKYFLAERLSPEQKEGGFVIALEAHLLDEQHASVQSAGVESTRILSPITSLPFLRVGKTGLLSPGHDAVMVLRKYVLLIWMCLISHCPELWFKPRPVMGTSRPTSEKKR